MIENTGWKAYIGDFNPTIGGGNGSNEFKFFSTSTGSTPVDGEYSFNMILVEDGDDENPDADGVQTTLNNDTDDWIKLEINGIWYEFEIEYQGSDRYGMPDTSNQTVAGVATITAIKTPYADGDDNWFVAEDFIGYDIFVPQKNYIDYIDNLPDGSILRGNRSELDPGDALIPCFCAGTLIETPLGAVEVEQLRVGDRVMTRDHGPQEIRWIGHAHLSAEELASRPNLRPVLLPQGSLGADCPMRDLRLSPQHRVLVRSKVVQRIANAPEALVAAKHLIGCGGIQVIHDDTPVDYYHILLSGHEIVISEGAETESFYIGKEVIRSIASPQMDELVALFPELAAGDNAPLAMAPARPFMIGRTGRSLAKRSARNRKDLVDDPLALAALKTTPAASVALH